MDAVRFGRLTVMRATTKEYKGTKYKAAECVCDCGSVGVYLLSNLERGATKSCGCYRAERTREVCSSHRLSGSPVYTAWHGMIRRCTDPKHKHYSYYGGRGVQVCERWMRIDNFVADMGHPPHKATLDRIDNERGYEPSNCRWASRKEQANNTRVRVNSKSRCKGVHWVPRCNLWYSQIAVDGKRFGGYSRTLLDAVALRYRLERDHWST